MFPPQENSKAPKLGSSKACVARAAKLFGLDEAALAALLLVKTIQLPGQTTALTVRLLGAEAAFRRDAVSRALYAGVFSWLVAVANGHLGNSVANKDLPFIGVLDIFGFESFAENGLEQILINFANEYLQNVFNKQVFEAEMKLFEEENMVCALDVCPDNQPCVDLLAARGGLLPTLNDQCAQMKPSEDKFVRDVQVRPPFFFVLSLNKRFRGGGGL
jgi:myosin heavy subunit